MPCTNYIDFENNKTRRLKYLEQMGIVIDRTLARLLHCEKFGESVMKTRKKKKFCQEKIEGTLSLEHLFQLQDI